MPNSKHLTRGISNLMSLITKIKLGLSVGQAFVASLSLSWLPQQRGLRKTLVVS
jgi:hypothetical protein